MMISHLDASTSASPDLNQIAAELSAGLSSVEVFGGRAYIRTPLLLPSGSSVVVVVEQEDKDRFRITDLGQGFDEAETLGFGRVYRRQAEEVAKLHGLVTTHGEIRLGDLAREELVGASMALASAVLRAFERAMIRAADRRPQPP